MQQEMILYSFVFIVSITIQWMLQKYMESMGYGINKLQSKAAILVAGMMVVFLCYRFRGGYPFFLYSLLIELLVVISMVDLNHKVIMDRYNLAIGALGIGNMMVTGDYYNSIIAFFISGGLFLLLAVITKGGIGGGDIKMIAPLGLLVGIMPILYIITGTFLLGAVVGVYLILLRKKSFEYEMALAPYICLATILVITYQ